MTRITGDDAGRAMRRTHARLRFTAVVAVTALLVGCGTGGDAGFAGAGAIGGQGEAAPTPTHSPTPTPTPRTPEELLLAETSDPTACAVTFAGEAITVAPMLQREGTLYDALPIPRRDGLVFAGWYATPADATGLAVPGRVNGSDIVAGADRRTTLHGAWTTPERNAAENARIPILMYHQFTTNPEGERGWLRGNYAYIGDFDVHMNHIANGGFYQPTWDELSAFIDGRLFLPDHSVIVTDDDADQTWFDLAAPIVGRYRVLTTSFMITAYRQDPPPNPYVLRRSHTHDMHRAGANGDGLMTNLSVDEIVADMEASFAVLGVKEVMAYPFGHVNDTAKEGLRRAVWEMARTIDQGYVTIGTDKLALPTVRIAYGMGLDSLIRLIG